jgi:hypothetical protein
MNNGELQCLLDEKRRLSVYAIIIPLLLVYDDNNIDTPVV